MSEENNTDQFTCDICYDAFLINDAASFDCDHTFCTGCIRNHLTTLIDDGQLRSLRCPQSDCESIATDTFVKKYVTVQLYQRYQHLLIKDAVGGMDDVVYCPVCDAVIEAEIDIGMANCYGCELAFCTSCFKKYHGTSDCELDDSERRRMVQMYQDELLAETLMSEEFKNQLVIDELVRQDLELENQIKKEQDEIRIQENLDNVREQELLKLEMEQAENERKEQERIKFELEQIVIENERKEQERIIAENIRKEQEKKGALAKKRLEEAESENFVRANSRPCPNCQAPTQKNLGCNHMTCTKCQYHYCWECMGHFAGYDHKCNSCTIS